MAFRRYRDTERKPRLGRRVHLQAGDEGVIGQRKAIALIPHAQPRVEWHVVHLPAHALPEGGEFRLSLRVRTGDNDAVFLVEHFQAGLPVEIKTAGNVLRRYNPGEAHDPWARFTYGRRHGHAIGKARRVLRDWRERPVVVVERVLCQTPDVLERAFAGPGKAREKFRVPAAIGEMGEAEVSPRADISVPPPVVRYHGGSAVRIGEVLVERCGALERRERGGVLAVLVIERHARDGQVVV